MSERPIPRETIRSHPEQIPLPETPRISAESYSHEAPSPNPEATLQEIRDRLDEVHDSGTSSARHLIEEEPTQPITYGTQRALKEESYTNTMYHIRSALPAPSRVFSKVIHSPLVENTSQIVSKSIGRPTGLLWGGLVSLAASSFSLFFAKRYGFEYNFGILILSFLTGYLVASIIEAIYHGITRNRRP